jgi:hypothetical protein
MTFFNLSTRVVNFIHQSNQDYGPYILLTFIGLFVTVSSLAMVTNLNSIWRSLWVTAVALGILSAFLLNLHGRVNPWAVATLYFVPQIPLIFLPMRNKEIAGRIQSIDDHWGNTGNTGGNTGTGNTQEIPGNQEIRGHDTYSQQF